MGCKTSGDVCSGGFFGTLNTNHCIAHRPGEGVTLEFKEYPPYDIRGSNYNLPDRDGNAVMYGSIGQTDPVEASAANCGKVSIASPCSSGATTSTIYFDYYPKELSFDYILSDTWFSYLYDTSDDAGVAGTPCYYIEERETSTTTTTTPGDPQDPPSETTGTETTTTCIPCTAFYCTPAETNLRYTADEDLTGDPDCPHPTLFAFGTNSNKIAFKYNELSTVLPNGVTDFSLSYDGVTYQDAWDEGNLQGLSYESSQNPWQSGDEGFADFQIFELDSYPTSTGLIIKAYIQPIFDDTGPTVVFSGTRWTISELLAPGTGYSVNDVFQLEYLHTHPDNSQTNITINLKITGVGPVDITSGQSGFDVLRPGDTINGHVITRTFHTDLDNFPYHVAYLDGNGNDFVKDTQYTSNRAHVITVKAGYAIPDRAIIVGLYEFLGKSIQYVTADVNRNSPDIYDTLVQPEITTTVTNGRLTGATIVNGGSGWNQLGQPPKLGVTAPPVSSGKIAVVEGTFSGGVLTGIQIKDSGSGYLDTSPPAITVRNIYRQSTTAFTNDAYNPEFAANTNELLEAIPKGDLPIEQETFQSITDVANSVPEKSTVNNDEPSFVVKTDPERNRVTVLPQSMYSKKATDPIREELAIDYDLRYLEDAPLDSNTKEIVTNERTRQQETVTEIIDAVTQEKVPEFKVQKEVLVETVQGSFKNLPRASRYTKYFMRQYRPDSKKDTTINLTLSCSPVDSGCEHFACSPPTPSIGGTTTDSTTDPITGDTTDTTSTTTYTVSPLLGDGCKSWSASGSMKIFNDLTRSANTVAAATAAYGNPYDE